MPAKVKIVPRKKTPHRKCEVKTEFCSGELMKTYKGALTDDPIFDCCGACAVILRRAGIKFKEHTK